MEGHPEARGPRSPQPCKAKVLHWCASVTVTYGSVDNVLVTKEWTPLDLRALEHMFYAPCVDLIKVAHVRGGPGESVLVDVWRPGGESAAECAAPGR